MTYNSRESEICSEKGNSNPPLNRSTSTPVPNRETERGASAGYALPQGGAHLVRRLRRAAESRHTRRLPCYFSFFASAAAFAASSAFSAACAACNSPKNQNVMNMSVTERPRNTLRWMITSAGMSIPKSMYVRQRTSATTTPLKKVKTSGRVPGSSSEIAQPSASGSCTS
ncbi:hypothetical protein T492DRAFT_1086199 [Pavlovales sp. CCMP2436]|nr:hypothetical protein T492DRAFT_1086199 [Pavlovales sp. CCMP2436]